MQVLGAVLLWAHRANAVRVDYSGDRDEPFRYFDSEGNPVQSEFVQPPDELRAELTQTLFFDTIDGHPTMRPFRRMLRRCCGCLKVAILRVPDTENHVESEWRMTVGDDITVFERTYSSPAHAK